MEQVSSAGQVAITPPSVVDEGIASPAARPAPVDTRRSQGNSLRWLVYVCLHLPLLAVLTAYALTPFVVVIMTPVPVGDD